MTKRQHWKPFFAVCVVTASITTLVLMLGGADGTIVDSPPTTAVNDPNLSVYLGKQAKCSPAQIASELSKNVVVRLKAL